MKFTIRIEIETASGKDGADLAEQIVALASSAYEEETQRRGASMNYAAWIENPRGKRRVGDHIE